ncbi:DUF447 domain-containing protein [Stratiformator vulcanicus]|uniref:Uncharacterized protein n=1 Tax=Stratiformator vulcanicus TaxID=2527980 RepID=A0A517R2M5_9PLAN|nr:DUF447 domain-containing protein [Stratiformator vulcanicus]QDT38118.1 hypothetical protein Pan189_25080 [Stratiformator vulcanicus]
MVVEGLVTTTNADGTINVSPMGPLTSPQFDFLTLRPFEGSQTLANLRRDRSCVFHVTDDVLLLTRAMLNVPMRPDLRRAEVIDGWVLADTCRWFELKAESISGESPRLTIETTIEHVGIGRPFFGWNRAKHAVLEAAVLASRVHLLDGPTMLADFEPLRVIVEKTGNDDEREAFALLKQHVESAPAANTQAES